jgi:lysophospholipase L1-like esterase
LNAAVNFNRIPEVVSGYLTEWIGWNPDLVIVMGSANNFGYAPLRGQVDRREVGILQPHAWFLEFERQANGTSLGAFGERVIRAIADHSAAAALVRRFLPQFVDAALTWSRSNSTSNAIPAYPSVGPVASFDEYDRYVKEYLAYAAALTGAARVQGQQVAFFWEYWIAHLGGIRPFNQEEELLYRANRVFHRPEDRDYDFRARDQVRDFASREGAFFIDPLERLKTEPSTVFTDYLHYTSNGNAVMADEVHRQLESWLQARARAIRNAAFSSDPAPAR